MRKLRPYQVNAVNKSYDMNSVAFFLEMRLGKSLVAIRWAMDKCYGSNILIICPKSVIPVWVEELKLEGIIGTPLSGSWDNKLKLINNIGWYIINYEGILSCPHILYRNWQCTIVDESTRIRNPKAKITKTIERWTRKVPFKAILSGLPNPESEIDYVEQMRFLFNGKLMGCDSFWKWRSVHCFQVGYNWELRKWAKEKLLKVVAENSIVLSRKEAGIGEEKIYEKRYVEMSVAQKKAYKEMMKWFETNINGEEITTKYAGAKIEYLTQIASGITPEGKVFSENKFKEVINLLEGELKNESVVIWCKHTIELLHFCDILNNKKIRFGIQSGKQKYNEKEFKLGKFKIMLAQPKGSQYGLNWSVADTEIFFSNWWDGEIRAQAEDRIVSVEKKNPLLYIDIITRRTIEEDIVEILRKKKLNSTKFLEQLIQRIKSGTKKH